MDEREDLSNGDEAPPGDAFWEDDEALVDDSDEALFFDDAESDLDDEPLADSDEAFDLSESQTVVYMSESDERMLAEPDLQPEVVPPLEQPKAVARVGGGRSPRRKAPAVASGVRTSTIIGATAVAALLWGSSIWAMQKWAQNRAELDGAAVQADFASERLAWKAEKQAAQEALAKERERVAQQETLREEERRSARDQLADQRHQLQGQESELALRRAEALAALDEQRARLEKQQAEDLDAQRAAAAGAHRALESELDETRARTQALADQLTHEREVSAAQQAEAKAAAKRALAFALAEQAAVARAAAEDSLARARESARRAVAEANARQSEAESALAAQSDAALSGDNPESALWLFLRGSLSGEARYQFSAFVHDSDQPEAQSNRNEVRLELRVEAEISDAVEFVIVPQVIFDDDELSEGGQEDPLDDELTRQQVALKEAYLRVSVGDFDIRAGELVFSFGSADLLNPTDVLNALDYTVLLDPDKIGVPAVEVSWWPGGGNHGLKLMWLPAFVPARLPPAGERYYPIGPDSTPPIVARDLPATTLANSEGAARVEMTFGPVDVSLLAFRGFNRLPSFRTILTAQAPFVALQPTYDRRTVLGADVAFELSDWVAHAEAAHVITDSDSDDDYLQGVVGLNRSWYPYDRELQWFVEVAGEWVAEEAAVRGVGLASGLQRAFSGAVLSRLQFEPARDLVVEVAGGWIFDGPDSWFVQPKLSYRLGPHTELAFGADLMDGEDNAFFTLFHPDERAYFTTTLSF